VPFTVADYVLQRLSEQSATPKKRRIANVRSPIVSSPIVRSPIVRRAYRCGARPTSLELGGAQFELRQAGNDVQRNRPFQ
jgi:hypothetical protein